MTEEVCRIVLVLHSHKPLLMRSVGGLDALGALLALNADLVDVVAARGERPHHLCQLARPPDIDVVCSGIEPSP